MMLFIFLQSKTNCSLSAKRRRKQDREQTKKTKKNQQLRFYFFPDFLMPPPAARERKQTKRLDVRKHLIKTAATAVASEISSLKIY